MTTLPLFAWLSPSFPVGAYAYSHGLEWAVEDGDVTDEASLAGWLTDTLRHGAGRNDAILLACSYRAASAGDAKYLNHINELALALAPSQELRLETAQQGRSFLDAALAAWPHPDLAALGRKHRRNRLSRGARNGRRRAQYPARQRPSRLPARLRPEPRFRRDPLRADRPDHGHARGRRR